MRHLKLKFEASVWSIILVAMLIGSVATAGAIKVWSSNDTLTAADLNANFAAINNNYVGNNGAKLVDADVNASAAISTSKLAAYRYVPVAWGTAYTTNPITACSADPCTTVGAGIGAVNRTPSAGHYVVHFSVARNNSVYTVLVKNAGTTEWSVSCFTVARSTSTMSVDCVNSGSAYTDAAFDFVVFDND